MSYGDILVYLPLPRSSELVEASVKLAKEFGAHLTAISSLPITAMLRDAVQNPFIRLEEAGEVEKAIRGEAEQAEEAERHFDAVSKRAGVSHEWEMGEGDPGDVLIYASRLQDLIILEQCGEASELLHGPVVQVVLSGHPALVVPRACTSLLPVTHAVIAWNGSAQASAAVRQALPFLTRAGRVSLLRGRPRETRPGSWRVPPLDIEAYLRRHRIEAETVEFDLPDAEAGPGILTFAEGAKADLIVMGAFGRSRFKEWVLGGATRLVLERMTTPVFMVH